LLEINIAVAQLEQIGAERKRVTQLAASIALNVFTQFAAIHSKLKYVVDIEKVVAVDQQAELVIEIGLRVNPELEPERIRFTGLDRHHAAALAAAGPDLDAGAGRWNPLDDLERGLELTQVKDFIVKQKRGCDLAVSFTTVGIDDRLHGADENPDVDLTVANILLEQIRPRSDITVRDKAIGHCRQQVASQRRVDAGAQENRHQIPRFSRRKHFAGFDIDGDERYAAGGFRSLRRGRKQKKERQQAKTRSMQKAG
jgi:hypothetical protein